MCIRDRSTAIVWFAVGYAPLAVGPPDHWPQQMVQLQYPLVTTCPKDSPTRTIFVSVTVSRVLSVSMLYWSPVSYTHLDVYKRQDT